MHMMGAIEEEDKLDADEAKKVLRRAGRMALPFKKTIAGALAFTALSTLGIVLGPVILRWGIDSGIEPGDKTVLRNAVFVFLGLTVMAYLAARQQFILINKAGEGFLRALRVRVFDHIQKQSLAFFDRNKSGVLVARMTADIESMGELVQWGLLQFVSAILLVIFALILSFAMSWQLTLVGLLVMPVIIVASRKFQRDSNAAYLDVREQIGQTLSSLQEGIAGVRTSGWSSRPVCSPQRSSSASAGGCSPVAMSRSARSSLWCCCSRSCSSRCSSSRSSTTRCSRRRLRSTSCSASSTRSLTSRTASTSYRAPASWWSMVSASGIPKPRQRC